MAASLLGIFTGAHTATATATTSTRTTTAGSLVTGCGANWVDASGAALAITDNQANGYTESFESEVGAFINFCLAYNLAGTRGAGHTVTITKTGAGGSPATSVTAQEWDGIAASPTIDTGALANGTSTSPSCSVTVTGGAALIVAMVVYDGSATTITVSDGTQASEQDESNTRQAQNVAYKLSQTGSVTIAWTLGASRVWGCRAVAFEESGGGAAGQPTVKRFGGVPGMSGGAGGGNNFGGGTRWQREGGLYVPRRTIFIPRRFAA